MLNIRGGLKSKRSSRKSLGGAKSKKKPTVGSRAQVWHGNAKHTSGGLTKDDLMMKKGRIVSRRASKSAKKNQNLKKAGYTTKKGVFGAFKNGKKVTKKTKRSRK